MIPTPVCRFSTENIGQWADAVDYKPLTRADTLVLCFIFHQPLLQEITNATITQADGVTTLTFVRPLQPEGDGKEVQYSMSATTCQQ